MARSKQTATAAADTGRMDRAAKRKLVAEQREWMLEQKKKVKTTAEEVASQGGIHLSTRLRDVMELLEPTKYQLTFSFLDKSRSWLFCHSFFRPYFFSLARPTALAKTHISIKS